MYKYFINYTCVHTDDLYEFVADGIVSLEKEISDISDIEKIVSQITNRSTEYKITKVILNNIIRLPI